MACLECRRRRIKCDGIRPTCNHCGKLNKSCQYASNDARRGPKSRGKSSRDLEARLAAMEAQLDAIRAATSATDSIAKDAVETPATGLSFDVLNGPGSEIVCSPELKLEDSFRFEIPTVMNMTTTAPNGTDLFPSVIEIEELNSIFFDIVYPNAPFIHPRYHDPAAILPKARQPPLALKYAMWTLAAIHSHHLLHKAQSYYKSARMHLEHDEMDGDGLGFVSFYHVQAWALVGNYEMLVAIPTRAFMSTSKAITLSQMLDLHLLDFVTMNSADVVPTKVDLDSTDLEERRRTFWYLFVADKWMNAGPRHRPSSIRDSDISTYLPASEAAFLGGRLEQHHTFGEVLAGNLFSNTAPLIISAYCACFNSECVHLLAQVSNIKLDEDEHKYWKNHDDLDGRLQKALREVPKYLLPEHHADPSVMFSFMCFHEFIISIFMAATKIAVTSSTRSDMVGICRNRARSAAEEIVNLMRAQLNTDVRRMSSYTPSALYMASTVFVNDLARGFEIEKSTEAILFLLFAIKMFKTQWKIAQVFLARLLADLKGIGIEPEMEQDDLEELHCWTGWAGIKTDLDALGPLFTQSLLLDRNKA